MYARMINIIDKIQPLAAIISFYCLSLYK